MSRDQQALQLLRAGRLAEAEQLFLAIANSEPANAGARHFLGIIFFQQGRESEALEWIDASLMLKKDAGVLTSRGNILQALGRQDEALESYDQALNLQPGLVNALFNRGTTLAGMQRPLEALACYDKALAIDAGDTDIWLNRSAVLLDLEQPEGALAAAQKAAALGGDIAQAWVNGGIALLALKRPEEALAHFDKALALQADCAEAHNGRGLALKDLKRHREALAAFEHAVALKPSYAEAWNDRGGVLIACDRKAEAMASYEKALAIRPDYGEALYNQANLLQDLRRFAQALAVYDRAVALNPRHARAWNNRGTLLWRMRRLEEARGSYDRALAIRPDDADVLHKRGNMRWAEMKDLDGGIADLERAAAADPDSAYLLGDLMHLKMSRADWRDFDARKAAIDQGVAEGKPVVQPLYYLTISDSPAAIFDCTRAYTAALHPAAAVQTRKAAPNVARRDHKFRIGYLAGEFRTHPVGLLSVGLFEHHDRHKFEIIAFDNHGDDGSQTRKRMTAAFDRMIDISALADDAAAQRIEAEGIQILVDMIGYTRNDRMNILARRPAPVQVSYLGYPGTLGASYVDYVIGDPIVIPEDQRKFYSEKIACLPDSYQANDCRRALPQKLPARAECGLPDEGFVFCNFNHIHKLTPDVFTVWMRILGEVPDSVLWLLESTPGCAQNLRREALARSISGERLIFAPQVGQDAHIARLGLADLSLDTLPYNAHTTASDALWMGVPLITCRGNYFAGRVAASLLHAMDVPELVTGNWRDYEALAVSLARDPKRLGVIRTKLAGQRRRAPLFDTARYCRHLESAYAVMWQRHQRGEAPQSFAVPPAG